MNHRLLLAASILVILGFAVLQMVTQRPPFSRQIKSLPATVTRIIDGDTIEVHFNGDPQSTSYTIRLAGINAPEVAKACQIIGKRARDTVKGWVPQGTKVSIELGSTGDKYVPYYIGVDRRLLGFVQTSPRGAFIQTELTKLGLARLEIRTSALRDVKQPNSDKFTFAKLFSSQIKSLLNAQTEAAKQKRGWWSTCDPFRKANLVIAAIDFWDYPQVVYIVNRGKLPINWTKFSLSDNTRSHRLDFNKLNAKCPMLAAGQVLEVDTYDEQGENKVNYCGTERIIINWYKPIGTGNHVWNEGDEGDTACLFLTAVSSAGCKKDATQPAKSNDMCYIYQYPPQDGTQTSSATIDSRCPRLAKAGDGNH